MAVNNRCLRNHSVSMEQPPDDKHPDNCYSDDSNHLVCISCEPNAETHLKSRAGEEAEDKAEGAERESLKSLARITPEQARAAALAQVPGTVKKVELENEDGNVVYGVEIKTANGESDVKVDAWRRSRTPRREGQ